jgi:hypothetical protein
MAIEIGNTSGSFYGMVYPENCVLESFTLVNKTNAAITANLAIKRNSVDYQIIPRNTTINMYEMYISDVERQIIAGDNIVLLVTGSTDYNFNLSK